MKKKALLYGLCVALLLSLTACGKAQAEQPPAEPEPPEVETTAPEPLEEAQPVQQFTTSAEDEEDLEIGLIEEQDGEEELHELTQEELTGVFEMAYSACTAYAAGVSTDHLIEMELRFVTYLVPSGQKLPSDYEDQYRAWRPVDTQESVQQSQPASTPANSSNSTSTASTGTNGTSGSSGSSGSSGGGGRIIEEDGSSKTATTEDPRHHITQEELLEGIDPNHDPWDTEYRVVYGGSGG